MSWWTYRFTLTHNTELSSYRTNSSYEKLSTRQNLPYLKQSFGEIPGEDCRVISPIRFEWWTRATGSAVPGSVFDPLCRHWVICAGGGTSLVLMLGHWTSPLSVWYITPRTNSKHWFATSFLGGRCRKAMHGVWSSTQTFRRALTVSVDSCAETKSGSSVV